MLLINDLSYTYPGEKTAAVSGASLHVHAGECVCLIGHSGCGKTTLLLLIKGLLHEGIVSGNIKYGDRFHPGEMSLAGLGLVFQNSETQLLCATVFDEVAFGPENLCLQPSEINARIYESLSAVNLLHFGNRNVERFSAGQKQRICIASVLSMRPDVILLDEPTSQLDRKGKKDLCAVLSNLKERGIAIIMAEHNIEPFSEIVDRYCLMEKGKIIRFLDSPPEKYPGAQQFRSAVDPATGNRARKDPIISADRISVSYPGSGTIIRDLSLTVMPGELIHILGENGSGKSTLLKTISGALQADSGSLRVRGKLSPKAGDLLGTVALLLQNPQRQLFEDTVFEEVAFTLKRLNHTKEDIDYRVKSALELCEATHLAARFPLTLSFGEQHRIALASVIAPEPKVLLLDEPCAGLDHDQRLRLLKILANLCREKGTAIVIASHDPIPAPDWPDRTLVMEGGTIVAGEASA